MPTLRTRRLPPARRLERPSGETTIQHQTDSACRRGSAGLRRPPRPTRGPAGEVQWWARPAPGGHEDLWAAVCQLQARRQQLRMTVAQLARLLADRGHPLTRETLSRVLNGKQPTSWATVEALADVLCTDVLESRDP